MGVSGYGLGKNVFGMSKWKTDKEKVTMKKECPKCEGKGTIKCSVCKGYGSVSDSLTSLMSKCIYCSGRGTKKCPQCKGKGTVED